MSAKFSDFPVRRRAGRTSGRVSTKGAALRFRDFQMSDFPVRRKTDRQIGRPCPTFLKGGSPPKKTLERQGRPDF